MKLADWLKREGIKRGEFAERVGVSPGRMTQLCAGEWLSRDTAEAIARETNGEVTPNDFLDAVPAPGDPFATVDTNIPF